MSDTVEKAIYDRLAADATVASLGATGWPVQAVQSEALPLFTYTEADQRTIQCLADIVSLNIWDIEIDCYAADYTTCKALRKAIRDSLNGFSGTLGTVTVRGIFHSGGGGDSTDPPIEADELGIYHAGASFAIHYEET